MRTPTPNDLRVPSCGRAEALRVIRTRPTSTDPPVWVSVPLIALAGWLVLTLLCLL